MRSLLCGTLAGFAIVLALGSAPQNGGTFATDGRVQIWVRGTYKIVSETGSGRCVFQPPLGHEYLVGGDAVITVQSMLGHGCGDESHLTCRTPVQFEFDPVGGPSFHPLGDFNMDGDVDLKDFAFFQAWFRSGGPTDDTTGGTPSDTGSAPDEPSEDDEYTTG